MDVLLPLIGFSFVSAATPGPNNVLLWASGAAFGFRRTVPHIVGTGIGIGAMALGVAVGVGALIAAVPPLAFVMKLAGSAYLLYLAARLARAGALERANAARPMSVISGAVFQVINPKGWLFALGAMTTFRPTNLPVEVGSALVVGTMVLVVLPSASLWAAAGDSLSRFIAHDRRRRIVSLMLAAVVAATVIFVWV